LKICKGIRNSVGVNSASMKIASCTLNLIQKPVIMNDLELLVSFHRVFLFSHFNFLQGGNPRTRNREGYLQAYYYLLVSQYCS